MGWFDDDIKKRIGKTMKKTLSSLGPPELRGYKNWTLYVPQTKKYLVHKGEMVIPIKEATALRRKMKLKKAPVKKKTNKK